MTGGGRWLDGLVSIGPIAMVWCLGCLLVWGHVTTASRVWEREREQRAARRRLRRAVAAWEQFRAEYERSETTHG